MRATAYHGVGDYANALSDLDAAQPGLWGTEAGVFKMRGDIAMASKRFGEALKYYRNMQSYSQTILVQRKISYLHKR
jgi:predicted negative regulator of RcsB-dependent stress response